MTDEPPVSLDSLHDVVVPDPVSWWPPAPGWWPLLALAAALAAGWLAGRIARWCRNAYRRAALRELDAAAATPDGWRRLNGLLKRTALSAWPRERVAGLSGDPWTEFLDRSSDGHTWSGPAGRLLLASSYDPAAQPDEASRRDLFEAARRWILRHRVDPDELPAPASRC